VAGREGPAPAIPLGRPSCLSSQLASLNDRAHLIALPDVYAAIIPDVPFIPGLHVNYSETKLPIRDGLLKLKDFPHGFGGSGIEVAE
jgi:hypothetical protein